MNDIVNNFWNTKWVLSLMSGILLGLSWPPLPFPFLVFPGFILIFRIIDLSVSARQAALWTYPSFLIWNIITTYWLMMATLAGGIAAILANAVLMTLPVMLQHRLQQSKWPPVLIAFFQAACWLSYEYLHHQWDLAWPWLTVGNAWANALWLIQYISVTGFWGITFWVLSSSALAYQCIAKAKKSTKIAFGAIFLIFPIWSIAILGGSSSSTTGQKQEVVVIQPNFNSYENYGGYNSSSRAIDHLLKLTDSVRTPQTNLVVWPENAVQTSISNLDTFSSNSIDSKIILQQKAKQWDATLIAGATYFEYYNTDEEPPLPYRSNQNAYLFFNAALAFYPDQPVEIYRKHNLVPIVERMPFVHFLNAVDIFKWINWNRIQGYGKGNRSNQFSVANTKTPALVCYDSVYPSWIREFVQQGAGFLTIITNDGWWGYTSGHEQHFAYARLRAIEFDRWIIRSANNGISGIIAPDGSIKVETPYWKSTAFRYEVPVRTSRTIYTRFGDWLPIGLLILTVLGFSYLLLCYISHK